MMDLIALQCRSSSADVAPSAPAAPREGPPTRTPTHPTSPHGRDGSGEGQTPPTPTPTARYVGAGAMATLEGGIWVAPRSPVTRGEGPGLPCSSVGGRSPARGSRWASRGLPLPHAPTALSEQPSDGAKDSSALGCSERRFPRLWWKCRRPCIGFAPRQPPSTSVGALQQDEQRPAPRNDAVLG